MRKGYLNNLPPSKQGPLKDKRSSPWLVQGGPAGAPSDWQLPDPVSTSSGTQKGAIKWGAASVPPISHVNTAIKRESESVGSSQFVTACSEYADDEQGGESMQTEAPRLVGGIPPLDYDGTTHSVASMTTASVQDDTMYQASSLGWYNVSSRDLRDERQRDQQKSSHSFDKTIRPPAVGSSNATVNTAASTAATTISGMTRQSETTSVSRMTRHSETPSGPGYMSHPDAPKPTADNPYAGIPVMPVKMMGVPKAALHDEYSKPPRRKILEKGDFISWDDNGPPHILKFTAVFVCPLTGEVFPSGRYGDEKLYTVTKDIGNGRDEEVVWYNKKATAEHGAAARAYDCISYRSSIGTTRSFTVIGSDRPYPADCAMREPSSTPAVVKGKINAARRAVLGDSAMEVDEDQTRRPPNEINTTMQ